MTLLERAEGGLPDAMAMFYNDGGGNLECFHVGAQEPNDGAVYCFFHENRELYRDAASFSDFLAERLARPGN